MVKSSAPGAYKDSCVLCRSDRQVFSGEVICAWRIQRLFPCIEQRRSDSETVYFSSLPGQEFRMNLEGQHDVTSVASKHCGGLMVALALTMTIEITRCF